MSEAKVRSAGEFPEHGAGGLGQVAHGVLGDVRRRGAVGEEVRLFVGLNTLADRPFPFVGYTGFPAEAGAWLACGGNTVTFLEAAVRSLREQPVPPGAAFDEAHHRMQKMLRQDAIVLACSAYTVLPGESAAGKAILDNLAEGYLLPEDLELSPAAQRTDLVWAVDRAGERLIMLVPPGAPEDEPLAVRISDEDGKGSVVFDLLSDLLDAQYTWTRKVFG